MEKICTVPFVICMILYGFVRQSKRELNWYFLCLMLLIEVLKLGAHVML